MKNVPLHLQEDILPSTQINRFSLVASDAVDPETYAHGRTAHTALEERMLCQVNRYMDNRVLDTIPPTPANVRTELVSTIKHMKINDHLMVYVYRVNIDWLTAAFLREHDAQHNFVWIVVDGVGTRLATDLPFRYTFDEASDTVRSEREMSAGSMKPLIHCLYDATGEKPLTAAFLHAMEQNRHRMSIFQLLRALPGAVLATSYPVTTKKTFFGFG